MIERVIREPWWGAHASFKQNGWPEKEPGVGVSKEVIRDAVLKGQDLKLIVGKNKDTYIIPSFTFFEAAKKYKAKFTTHTGTVLWIVPLSLLKGK